MSERGEGIEGELSKQFYLQYAFPPFSVGEVGRNGAPGRREVGHGNLAERALRPAVPPESVFPYVVRAESPQGCNRTYPRLQPYASEAATVCIPDSRRVAHHRVLRLLLDGFCLLLLPRGTPRRAPTPACSSSQGPTQPATLLTRVSLAQQLGSHTQPGLLRTRVSRALEPSRPPTQPAITPPHSL